MLQDYIWDDLLEVRGALSFPARHGCQVLCDQVLQRYNLIAVYLDGVAPAGEAILLNLIRDGAINAPHNGIAILGFILLWGHAQSFFP